MGASLLAVAKSIYYVLRGIKRAISRKLVKISDCRVSSFLKTVPGCRVSRHVEKFKNGISLITVPVPIVCVFQGCVISSCWYFAQALLRKLITACLISLFFFSADWALWSAGDRRRRGFLFRQPSGPGKEFESTIFSVGRSGGRGAGGGEEARGSLDC